MGHSAGRHGERHLVNPYAVDDQRRGGIGGIAAAGGVLAGAVGIVVLGAGTASAAPGYQSGDIDTGSVKFVKGSSTADPGFKSNPEPKFKPGSTFDPGSGVGGGSSKFGGGSGESPSMHAFSPGVAPVKAGPVLPKQPPSILNGMPGLKLTKTPKVVPVTPTVVSPTPPTHPHPPVLAVVPTPSPLAVYTPVSAPADPRPLTKVAPGEGAGGVVPKVKPGQPRVTNPQTTKNLDGLVASTTSGGSAVSGTPKASPERKPYKPRISPGKRVKRRAGGTAVERGSNPTSGGVASGRGTDGVGIASTHTSSGASKQQGAPAGATTAPLRRGDDRRDGIITAPPENLEGLAPGIDRRREGDLRQRDNAYGENLTNVLRSLDLSRGNTLLIGNTGHPYPEAEAAANAGFQVVLRTDGVHPSTVTGQQLAESRNGAQLPPSGAYGPFRGLYIGTDAHRDTEGDPSTGRPGQLRPDAIPQDPDVTQVIVLTEAPYGDGIGQRWEVNPYKTPDDLAPLTWYQQRGIPVTVHGIDPRPRNNSSPGQRIQQPLLMPGSWPEPRRVRSSPQSSPATKGTVQSKIEFAGLARSPALSKPTHARRPELKQENRHETLQETIDRLHRELPERPEQQEQQQDLQRTIEELRRRPEQQEEPLRPMTVEEADANGDGEFDSDETDAFYLRWYDYPGHGGNGNRRWDMREMLQQMNDDRLRVQQEQERRGRIFR